MVEKPRLLISARGRKMIQTVKEYVQIYPLKKFPLLKEFHDNLHLYSKGKNEYWEGFIKNSLEEGLRIICRIVDEFEDGSKLYNSYISMVDGPEYDLFYMGQACEKKEEHIIQMLENYSDNIFSIDVWDKESMQKFFIEELLRGDFKDE